jgi:hypothetical protein
MPNKHDFSDFESELDSEKGQTSDEQDPEEDARHEDYEEDKIQACLMKFFENMESNAELLNQTT